VRICWSFSDVHAKLYHRLLKNEVLDVINGDRRLTVREVADKCGISKTTAHQILGNDLNMNRVCARCVPRILTAEHLIKRVELSKQLIKKVNRGGIRFLDRIITTDESWFHYYDPETKQQSSQWKNCNSPQKLTPGARKKFLTFNDVNSS
jgi:histone-lysine N-methyltransferase SETMAR